MSTGTPADDVTRLAELAAELSRQSLHATLHEPDGRLPFLEVRNPAASVLIERLYAQADSYWWSWAERIAGCDQVATVADTLARVLRTVDGE